MKLVFSGLEREVNIKQGSAAVLQIANPTLFSRIALSLMADGDDSVLEPYTLWDGEKEICFRDTSIRIPDPLNLPWDDKNLLGAVVKKMERDLLDDESLRTKIETAERLLSSSLLELGMSFNSEYSFSLEWDFRRYFKMLGFGIDAYSSYFDNLISFSSLALDAGCNKILVFVNLKTFLAKNDIERFYKHVFFSGVRVLMLENKTDDHRYEYEQKNVVDQHFLEF